MSTADQGNANYRLPTYSKPYRRWLGAMLVFTICMLLIHTGMSSWAALRMAQLQGGWFSELGSPVFAVMGVPVMKPWAWVFWDARLHQVPAFKQIFMVVSAGGYVSWLAIFPVKMFFNSVRYKESDVHGSAHWATKSEILKTGLLG